VELAAAGNKCLNDFEVELLRDLTELWELYVRNIRTIGGLCSPMPEGDPSAMDYIRWFSVEVGDLPKVFAGVSENFIYIAVEGALTMAGDSVDLDAIQDATASSGANILPMERDVWRAARAVAKNWWRSFGYDYVLDAIRTRLHEVIISLYFVYFCLIATTILLLFQVLKEKEILMVEEVPTKTPSGDHLETTMDVEVAKIVSENLTASEGRHAVETVAGVTRGDAGEEERVEV
jgi:hypothetical protein